MTLLQMQTFHDRGWVWCSSACHAEMLAALCLAASPCRTGLLVPAGTQISLGIPSSSDVQIPEYQDFLDIQARILGRQHGNSGSFLQPWNQDYKAVRELLWKVFARPAAQAQPKLMPWPWASQVLETKPGKICQRPQHKAKGKLEACKKAMLWYMSCFRCVTSACIMRKKMCICFPAAATIKFLDWKKSIIIEFFQIFFNNYWKYFSIQIKPILFFSIIFDFQSGLKKVQ